MHSHVYQRLQGAILIVRENSIEKEGSIKIEGDGLCVKEHRFFKRKISKLSSFNV